MMWVPWCVESMFHQRHEGKDSNTIALDILAMYERTAKNHKDLRAAGGGSVLLVSYVALVWDTLKTAKRIERFMLCLGSTNAGYVPRLGRDIIKKNRWKAHGSILDYGKSNPPKKLDIGYSVEEAGALHGGVPTGIRHHHDARERAADPEGGRGQ